MKKKLFFYHTGGQSATTQPTALCLVRNLIIPKLGYRVTPSTRPCYSGTLYKMDCPVYATVHMYATVHTKSVHFYKV